MPNIKFIVNNCELNITANHGDNLYKTMIQHNISVYSPCGGNGSCGKCKVSINGKIHLSCTYIIEEDIEVIVRNNGEARISTHGEILDETFFSEPSNLSNLTTLTTPHILTTSPNSTKRSSLYGVAVDIGTTTIAMYLYDLKAGERLGILSAVNEQKIFGSDVISRIQYTNEKINGRKELTHKIRSQLNNMLVDISNNSKTNPSDITKIYIAANTTMLHLLAGEDVAGIAIAPFTPVFLSAKTFAACELDLTQAPTAACVFLPSVSAYVGGDIVAGILATGMYTSEKTVLFIDIGTNGEIALRKGGKIYYCATAAGPALEGAKITCGMSGLSGAISKVEIQNDKAAFDVIGDDKPIGICGSGIVDLVAELIKSDYIDDTGYMDEDFYITNTIYFTPKDVREVQLAKAAIAAGIEVLCKNADTTISDIETCYLAGGFGSYINKNNACKIGLLPMSLLNRIHVVGNTSGMGAVMCLLSDAYKDKAEKIAAEAIYVELSGKKDFEEFYMDNMFF